MVIAEPNAFPRHAIAIVGMAGRFPGAGDLDQFWQIIREGAEVIERFSDADLDAGRVPLDVRNDPQYVRLGTALAEADSFDADFFGYSPREAQILDPQQRIFLECAWESLEHAGYAPDAVDSVVSVFAGSGMNTYLLSEVEQNRSLAASVGPYQLMLGNDKDYLCTRVSYKLNLRGASVAVQTACSTSLVAVQMACRALDQGECDMALAGGVSVPFPQRVGYLYQEGMIFSPDGHCRPFDAKAQGTRASAGCGIVVLKRLSDALADRDTIHAVIRGAAINNDGGTKAGFTAPSIEGQIEAIATAQALSGVAPRTIGYVEAHGTATALGDPIEITALARAFRASTSDIGFCRLGSLKANLGHLDAAAGVAGLIKVTLALENAELPPLANFETPNPRLDLPNSPFVADASARPWPATDAPRRACISSFGIGGTNAHVVLEEAPQAQESGSGRATQLLILSALSEAALNRACERLSRHIETHPGVNLADVAWTLQAGRKEFAYRRAIIAHEKSEAVRLLGDPGHSSVITGTHSGGRRNVAFLFSGQGTQHVGMGRGLYSDEGVFREAVDRCAHILEPLLGLDLRQVMYAEDAGASLDETGLAQPALFVTEYALACLWRQWGVEPVAMLGHSLGEYVAAHLAGVMQLEDVLAVVAARGRLMQALPPGRMAAVALRPEELKKWLAGSEVELSAINAPALCTVSGPAQAVDALAVRLSASGIDVRPLRTSHAFHSRMMEPALEAFAAVMSGVKLSRPRTRYLSNVTGTWITDAEAMSSDYYVRHLRQAVRFAACVQVIGSDNSLCLIEVGPGNVLATLARMNLPPDAARRILPSLGHRGDREDIDCLHEAMARMWINGVKIQWEGLHAARAPRRIGLPTYPFERKRFHVDPEPASPTDLVSRGGLRGTGDAPDRALSVADWFFAPSWKRSAWRSAIAVRGTWLVVGVASRKADVLCGRLRDLGAHVVRVTSGESIRQVGDDAFECQIESPEQLSEIATKASDGRPVSGAFCLPTSEANRNLSVERAGALYRSLLAIGASQTREAEAPFRLVVATAGGQSVLSESVLCPEFAAALGSVLVLPVDLPGLSMRWVDFADDAALTCDVDALIGEAGAPDQDIEVAYRGGRRWIRCFEKLHLPRETLELSPRTVVWITGGLGGMGLALAKCLATKCHARLLLTGRRALPPREEWDRLAQHPGGHDADTVSAIREIEAAGGEVLFASADASDEAAMGAALDLALKRWGRVDGVVHAAGIAGSGRLATLKTSDEVEQVMAPKIGGLEVLRTLLGETPLEFMILMSSINAVVRAPGVADYAAANAVMDAFVDSQGCPLIWKRVVAIDWGPWRDVGMAATLDLPESRRAQWRAYLAQSGISSDDGVEAFMRVLGAGTRRLVVLPYDVSHVVELHLRENARVLTNADHPQDAQGATPVRQSPGGKGSGTDPESDVEGRLARIWVDLLGVETVGVHDDFFALGGHSLLATRVLARIQENLGVRLTLRDLFDAPTLAQLSQRVRGAREDRPADVGAGDREEFEL